jgi:hypothetical protein
MSEDPSDRDSSGSDVENTCSAKVLVVKQLTWKSSDCLAVLKRLDSRVTKSYINGNAEEGRRGSLKAGP